jgi:site-specific recombinase
VDSITALSAWELAATGSAVSWLIGTVNLLVSFGLALWVALRARKIHFTQGWLLMKALGRRFARRSFFIGSREEEMAPPGLIR